MWYYRTLVDVLGSTGPEELADELARVVSEIEYLVSEEPISHVAEMAEDVNQSG